MTDLDCFGEIACIEGFPDYRITAAGVVVSLKYGVPTPLTPALGSSGYLHVGLRVPGEPKKTRRVHRLVCEAFHGPQPTPRHEVAHANGDGLDNRAGNLRWVTHRENEADKKAHGRGNAGEAHPMAKLTAEDVAEIRAKRASGGATLRALAEEFGVSKSMISLIVLRRNWR